MQNQLKDILNPTAPKIVLTVLLATLTHLLLVVDAVKQTTGATISGVQSFWLTNFFDSLPYLATDNTTLKFLTFFLGSYFVIWLAAFVFKLFDRAQVTATKKLRRKT